MQAFIPARRQYVSLQVPLLHDNFGAAQSARHSGPEQWLRAAV